MGKGKEPLAKNQKVLQFGLNVELRENSDQRLGFSLVGTLPNELDSGDVKLFVRPLDKKQ